MPFNIKEKYFNGEVVLIEPQVFEDERGSFMEVFREDSFKEIGLPDRFVQENHSISKKNVIRGLHFQWDPPMGKLMRVTRGNAFLVAVDIRKNSPTLGEWVGVEASEENRYMLWAPAYFARGFAALSDRVDVQYVVTGRYNHGCESGILWNDSDIGIKWPVKTPILSEKDSKAQTLKEWIKRAEADNFVYKG